MRRFLPMALMALAITASWTLSTLRAEDKPKVTIKEAMKLHKDGLHKKFIAGTATKEETAKLLEAYEAMAKSKPPKGDEADWKAKCEAIVKAVKAGDKAGFEKAVMCGACHSAHKP